MLCKIVNVKCKKLVIASLIFLLNFIYYWMSRLMQHCLCLQNRLCKDADKLWSFTAGTHIRRKHCSTRPFGTHVNQFGCSDRKRCGWIAICSDGFCCLFYVYPLATGERCKKTHWKSIKNDQLCIPYLPVLLICPAPLLLFSWSFKI